MWFTTAYIPNQTNLTFNTICIYLFTTSIFYLLYSFELVLRLRRLLTLTQSLNILGFYNVSSVTIEVFYKEYARVVPLRYINLDYILDRDRMSYSQISI